MQIPYEMKALRAFHTHKHHFLLRPTKTPTSLSFFAYHLHSTPRLSLPQEPSKADHNSIASGNAKITRQVWSMFDPTPGKRDDQESEGERGWGSENMGNLNKRGKTQMGSSNEFLYSGVKKENLSDVDETHEGLSSGIDDEVKEDECELSSFDKEIDDLSKECSSTSVKKDDLRDGDETQRGVSSGVDCGVGDGVTRKSYGIAKEGTFREGQKSRMGLLSYSSENEDLGNGRRYGDVKKEDLVKGTAGGKDVVGYRKKAKSRTNWVCENCGFTSGQWWGSCRSCNKVGTLKQFSVVNAGSTSNVSGIEVSENVVRTWMPQKAAGLHPVRLMDVNRGMNQQNWRIPLCGSFGSEVARVLGGGLVPGSLVLIGGDPGVGKSTLSLQIAAVIADSQGLDEPAPVVYVSGEESVEQIKDRAVRMKIVTEELFLYSSTDIEDIFGKIQLLRPQAIIVDSIQTVYLKGVTGSAGGLSQIKECASALLRFAKQTNVSVILVGHVNKDGEIAGPRLLEHIVDVVLYMEGEKYSSHRLLRPVKNRFGSTDELGVFEMSESGLLAVSNPSEIFLSEQHSDSEFLAGLAVAVIMDGSRSFLIEIQALCVSGAPVSRHVNGIQGTRADMIISVLMKQAGLMLQENSIFLNVVSGVTLKETAGDVATAAAICSSFLEFPIPSNVAFIGEIGLGGELHSVPRMEKRVNTLAKLGYGMCIVPESAENFLANQGFEGMKIIGCKNLKEVINTVFKAS